MGRWESSHFFIPANLSFYNLSILIFNLSFLIFHLLGFELEIITQTQGAVFHKLPVAMDIMTRS